MNHRGRRVSLASGPALGLAAAMTAAVGAPGLAGPALVAGLGATVAGRYDDLSRGHPGEAVKGLRGHLGALRAGRITSGLVKAVGVSASGVAAAALLPGRRGGPGRMAETLLAAGVIAGTANLVNLLDLRPGRALKAGLLLGAALVTGRNGAVAAGPVGAALAVIGPDLAERVMLGDAGANGFGAVLGVALAARTGITGRAALCGGLVAATVGGDRVSFTRAIERIPVLRALDQLGQGGERGHRR